MMNQDIIPEKGGRNCGYRFKYHITLKPNYQSMSYFIDINTLPFFSFLLLRYP